LKGCAHAGAGFIFNTRFMKKNIRSFLLLGVTALATGIAFSQDRSRKGDPRKYASVPVAKVESTRPPTLEARRLGPQKLIDGELPENGWRSTWTAWYKENPTLTFDLGSEKTIGVIRVFFQPWDRSDELSQVEVEVSRDGVNYVDFNTYAGFVGERSVGTWAEMDLQAIKARYFRLTPNFQGWGNLWGEVEFWEVKK
tara:strand:+ start:3295 stop:3885 length:591 start_codon:yes stop_codon:yes gene_type:complete